MEFYMESLYSFFGELFEVSEWYNLSYLLAYLMSAFYTIILSLVPLFLIKFVFNLFDVRR